MAEPSLETFHVGELAVDADAAVVPHLVFVPDLDRRAVVVQAVVVRGGVPLGDNNLCFRSHLARDQVGDEVATKGNTHFVERKQNGFFHFRGAGCAGDFNHDQVPPCESFQNTRISGFVAPKSGSGGSVDFTAEYQWLPLRSPCSTAGLR